MQCNSCLEISVMTEILYRVGRPWPVATLIQGKSNRPGRRILFSSPHVHTLICDREILYHHVRQFGH